MLREPGSVIEKETFSLRTDDSRFGPRIAQATCLSPERSGKVIGSGREQTARDVVEHVVSRVGVAIAVFFLVAPGCAEGKGTIDEPSRDYTTDPDAPPRDGQGCNADVDESHELSKCSPEAEDSPAADPCAATPDACHGAATLLVRGGHPRAYSLVFVPIGFSSDEREEYRKQTARATARLRDDRLGLVGRRTELFDFYRVDSFSGIRVSACVGTDGMIRTQDTAVRAAARAAVPQVDIVIAVVNALKGRAHSAWPDAKRQPVVVVRAHDDTNVFEHELGHAVACLGDEYGPFVCSESERSDPFQAAFETEIAPLAQANLSERSDGHEWQAVVPGAVPGGGGDLGACVYHPARSCRMGDEKSGAFCPVCSAAIDRVLAHRAGELSEAPRCVVQLDQDPNALSGRVEVRLVAATLDPPMSASLRVVDDEGRELGSMDLPPSDQGFITTGGPFELSTRGGYLRALCKDGRGREAGVRVSLHVKTLGASP
jgi:hypothetical protein